MKFILAIVFIFLMTAQCSTYRFNDLKRHEKNEDKQAVMQFLENTIDPYLRAQAAYSVGRMNMKEAIPKLFIALDSKDWIVRYYAAKSLLKLGLPKEYKEQLSDKVFHEKNEYVLSQLKEILKSID